MALEGKLSDFGFAEILQLVETQQKSGFLTLSGRTTLVFAFDGGVLISTRDRRREAPDPLERYLRRYGFFNDQQWKHVDFIRQNSSLDLTEILASERMLDGARLEETLGAAAQETIHRAMKMNQGDFVFTPVRNPASGLHGKVNLSVQGLLMEAARRLDEEARFSEAFPSDKLTFRRGSETPDADALSEAGRRIFKMALAGEPLGKIVNQAQVDAFVTQNTLFEFCQNELLVPARDGERNQIARSSGGNRRGPRFLPILRVPWAAVFVVVVALGIGVLRWQPLWGGALPLPGLSALAAGPSTMDLDRDQNRSLRLSQIRHDLQTALRLFHYRHGHYPPDLSLLVEEQLLVQSSYRTMIELGWTYSLDERTGRYDLGT